MKQVTLGILIGFVLCAGLVRWAAPRALFNERLSPFGFEETVQKIESAITNGEWIFDRKVDLQQTLAASNLQVPRVTLLKACRPTCAESILTDDEAMFASQLMPYSISIYEKSDGKTYVSTMNVGLVGRLFGGTIAKVLVNTVAPEAEGFTYFLIDN